MKQIQDNLKNFLDVKNINETSAELYFYGDIVSNWTGAYDDTDQYPESIKNFLKDCEGKDLEIHINSGGGSVFAGISIYNMLKNHEGSKTVYIDGLAASIASVIALAGDKVVMRTGSSLMIHNPVIYTFGAYNAEELRKTADNLDEIKKCIVQVYKENLKDGVSIETIEKLMDAETWFTSNEAEKYFDIETEELEAVACTTDLWNFTKKPDFISKKETDMENAKARLKLLKLEVKNEFTGI